MDADVKHLREAEAELWRGDLWWISEDGESGFADPESAYEAATDYGGYPDCAVQLDRALSLPHVWAVRVALTWDDNGDPDETEVRLFKTKAEAEAALAAIRLATGGDNA